MKISIVTPSYNQAAHLEQTIQSVLLAADGCGAELEYVVIDGGSTDGSRDILERHAHRFAYWCSEKDGGQYAAINKGFDKTTGEIMGWLNSSDLYCPWTLSTVREIFEKFPEVQWITSLPKTCIREDGGFDSQVEVAGFTASRFRCGGHGGPHSGEFIQQETCFWRRELWEKIGSKITDHYRYAADFWLWGEFFKHTRCTGLEVPLAAFRFHGDSRSTADRYMKEVDAIIQELSAERLGNFLLDIKILFAIGFPLQMDTEAAAYGNSTGTPMTHFWKFFAGGFLGLKNSSGGEASSLICLWLLISLQGEDFGGLSEYVIFAKNTYKSLLFKIK